VRRVVGIVVGSGWGAHAARALAMDGRAELRAIVSRGSPRSRLLAGALGVEFALSFEDALRRHRPDIVVLAAGEHHHEALALQALDHGAHVLCAHPVVPGPTSVARIAQAAERAGRVVRTDYTFRVRPELHALAAPEGRGQLVRVAIDAPGRWLPIALDVAVVVAGPVARVLVSARVPEALASRARSSPAAFPPALLLEHDGGVVTSFAAFPHARPGVPVDVRTSWERAQVRAALPAAGATLVALQRGGGVEERVLVPPTGEATSARAIEEAMHEVARSFVGAVLGERDPLATLHEEAHLRAVWSAIWRAVATHASAAIVPRVT
jgi:predicted dehydrogenase